MPTSPSLHLAVALDGAGWHPMAWLDPDARPSELFSAPYWDELARVADAACLDFVTIEDGLGLQSSRLDDPEERLDRVRGRLDAVMIAARVAPRTTGLGLVPTATTTHTEPFHVAKSTATLDFVSQGRAGWRAQVSGRASEAAHFGRRHFRPPRSGTIEEDPAVRQIADELLAEAADFVEVVRRLWDSWEDDAEIRDVLTGRFVDRDKLHSIDFEGRWFSVRGPSITPRPPQGQPVVAVLAHADPAYELAARTSDVVFVTPTDERSAAGIVADVRAHEAAAGRPVPLKVFADLLVYVERRTGSATARRDRLDELYGAPSRSDAATFAGTAVELAELLWGWRQAGIDGFRLRPATIPRDLRAITDELVPELRRRGLFRPSYQQETLRGRLGLGRPANRYAVA